MSTPALYNIKTVTGLQDCLVLQVIDSLGNVISGNNYVVRGAIALKGETYNLSVTQDALGDYLLTWGNLPAGVWRYDIFVNEEPLLYGNAIVQGRVTPCVTENTQDLGQFLQVQKDQEGVKITLSDVNSAKWYAEVAKGSADEAKNVLQETENLSLDIERQIEAGKTEISETTESSISSINNAENSAIANIDTEKENALDDLSQEVVKAQNYATSAQNSATQAETSATNAQESENKAKEAQTETEILANELDEKFARAVFTDNSGNVDIEGGLTVDGVANLIGGAVVPALSTIEMNKAVNLYGIMGFEYFRSTYIGTAIVNTNSILAGRGNSSVTKGISASLTTTSTKEPTIWKITFSAGSPDVYTYNGLGGFFIPFWVESEGAQEWYKFSFLLQSKGSGRFTENLTINDKDSFVISPTTAVTYCYNYDITFSISNNRTEVRCRQLGRNSADEQMKVREVFSTIPYAFNYSTRVRGIYVLNNIKTNKVEIFVLLYFSLFKVAEFQAFSRFSYELAYLTEIYVSRPAVPDSISGSYGNMFNQETFWHIQDLNTGEYASPWSDFANLIARNVITSNQEYNYEFATEE